MEDDHFDDDAIAIGIAHIARSIPRPSPAYKMPDSGMARLRALGLSRLGARFADIGIGPVAGGRLMLVSPDAVDAFLKTLGVIAAQETPLAAYCTAFGGVGVMTTQGKDILIEPLAGFVQIIETAPERNDTTEDEDRLMLEMDIATQIIGAIDDARDPDQIVDLQGRNLFKSVSERLGPLVPGQCYASRLPPDHPEHFAAENFEMVDLSAFLMDRHSAEPFDLNHAMLDAGDL